MRYSLEDVCHLTGLSPHAVRLCMRHRSIIPERQAHNRRKYDLSSADVASIREAAHELWPADETAGHAAASPDLSAVQGRLDALERRVRALETRQHAPALPPMPAQPRPPQTYVRASLDALTGEMFPQSSRGKGEWVELHGGPGRHYVREWPETKDWQGAADAIAGVRARGYPDFMRASSGDNATPQPPVEDG